MAETNVIGSIRTGIYSRLNSTSNFKTAIGSKLYFVQAKTGDSIPYAVFSFLPVNAGRDSLNKFYNTILQVNVYASTQALAETATGYLNDLLEDAESSITITGFKLIQIERMPEISLGKIHDAWGIVSQYYIEVQKN